MDRNKKVAQNIAKALMSIEFHLRSKAETLDFENQMNLGLLTGAIIASYLFWNSFYKEDLAALVSMKEQLHQLENQIILSGGLNTEEEE